MTAPTTWHYPTQIKFGVNQINELPDICKQCGIMRPLLVTDRGLASSPVIAGIENMLKQKNQAYAIFGEVEANPSEKNLKAGISMFNEGGYDGVVAIGGGSSLDLGKLIVLMAKQTVSVWDLEDVGDYWMRANAAVIKPIIAVPTTAGTGSEVGRAGVLTNSETHEKKVIFHPNILPAVAICDPQLTVGMPKSITAGTGMDAFAHCLEAYCSPHYHPMSQGIALEGMRLVKNNLIKVYQHPNDLEARAEMMSAAIMGATAFQKGLGAIHAISHPIGANYHKHHGTTNAVVMQEVLKFNRREIESKIALVAAYLEIPNGFDGFYQFVGELIQALDIPKNLTELGITNPDLDQLTKSALKDPTAAGNPHQMTYENTLQLIKNCL